MSHVQKHSELDSLILSLLLNRLTNPGSKGGGGKIK